MKKILVFVLCLAGFSSNCQIKQLNLASDVWPPFTNVDTARALALDIVKEALARNDVKVNLNILDFGRVTEDIRSGKFDGSAALWRDPEREGYLLFSEPYLENRLILVGKKGSNVSAGSFSELKGKRIAVVGSYAYGVLPGNTDNVLVPGTSDQQNLERLLSGKADYMLVDALLIEYLLEYQAKEAAEHLEIGNNTMLTRSLHFAIRKDIPGAQNLIEKFNAEINKMIVEGVYNKILQINWIDYDIDGDGNLELVLSGDHAGTLAPSNKYMLKGKSGQENPEGYYIEGVRYADWEHVPDKYKIPQGPVPGAEKRGFGPIFSF